MKVGIMQPYFVPYIGYWQLMNAVDKYVVYDDVNFIKGGWINRNRILVNGASKYFNLPMLGASPFKLINQIGVNNDERIVDKNLRMIEGAYKKAPYYKEIYPLIVSILKSGKTNVAEFIANSFYVICDYLDIKTEIIISSNLKKDNTLRAQDKVLAICQELGATEYYNAVGGQELYSFSDFKQKGIKLNFLKTNDIEYKQFGNDFQKSLSIIDVLMFNSKEEVKNMLKDFTLISE
jgi:hypothetical protein